MGPSRRPASRAPLYVTVAFFAIAVGLVLLALRATPGPPSAIESPGTARSPRPVNVIMRDYRFTPTPVVLVRGETVRFLVINGGLEPHEFVLGDAAVQAAWAAADAAATPPAPFATPPPASVSPDVGGIRILLPSGAQQVVPYTVPRGGELQLICHLPGHVEQGMVGTVELRDPPRDTPLAARSR